MKIHFSKYQGTGNDFILLDNMSGKFDNLSDQTIQFLCDRRFGIGADGLIKVNSSKLADFEMDYYNSDASKSFCGNGARCSVAFAETLGVDVSLTSFLAIDGMHRASKLGELVSLEMIDVKDVKSIGDDFEVFTGSPHYIRFEEQIQSLDIVSIGKVIRYSDTYATKGINVNLVQVQKENELLIHTYERGVENETLSCGTGVTAAAIAYAYHFGKKGYQLINTKVKGGRLQVQFNHTDQGVFTQVQLIGPAVFVFSGEIDV